MILWLPLSVLFPLQHNLNVLNAPMFLKILLYHLDKAHKIPHSTGIIMANIKNEKSVHEAERHY